MHRLIDLSSDTATRPSQEMLSFMIKSPTGDEQKNEDPTVNALQEQMAGLLGLEAALFLPSATMANQIALKVHTQPGDEVILDRESHLITSEAGGPAFLSGLMLKTVDGKRGIFSAQQAEDAIRRLVVYCPRSRVVSVEQTTNRGGGAVWPIENLRSIVDMAGRRGLRTHMDGSRLFNAAVASAQPAAAHVKGFDSVTVCLSKGLGCPVGAILAGSRAFIEEARRYKHILGGAMRQSGVIAGAGVFALNHNVERLADDHQNAKLLARKLSEIPGIKINVSDVETNIVFFDIEGDRPKGQKFTALMEAKGVRMGAWTNETQIRAVTHLDVSKADIEQAADVAAKLLAVSVISRARASF